MKMLASHEVSAGFMSALRISIKHLLVPSFLGLLTGCAVWTGGIPRDLADNGRYPVVASVHGVKEVTVSNNLQTTVTRYNPTNEIALSTNTVHGWLIQIPPSKKPLELREYYVLPAAARWPRNRIVSLDRTTGLTTSIIPQGAKYISNSWGMYADDPLGEYEIAVFLDGKLAADFKFRVIGK